MTFQRNRGLTLLKNYDQSLKNYENALNSAGVADKKFATYQESTAAKMDRARASIEGFWQNAISSDTIKLVIDGFSKLIEILDILANSSVGSTIIQVSLLTVALYGLGRAFLYVAGTSVIGNFIAGLSMAGHVLKLFATGSAVAGVELKALTATMYASPLFWPMAITTGVMLLVKAFDLLTTSLEEQRETVQTLSSDIQTLQSEYDKLLTKDNRTAQEEKHLAILEAQIEAQKVLLAQKAKLLVNREYMQNNYSVTDEEGNQLNTGNNKTNEINSNIASLERYNDQLSKLDKNSKGAFIQEQNLKQSIVDSIKLLSGEHDAIQKNIKTLEDAGEQDSEEYKNQVALASAIDDVIKKYNDKTNATNNSATASKNNKNAIIDQTAALKTFASTFKDSTAIVKQLNGVLDELDKGEGLSASTIDTLLEKHAELAIYLGDETKLREKLNELIDVEKNKVREDYISASMASKDFYKINQSVVETFFDNLKSAYNIDIKNWETLAEAKEDIDLQLIKTLGENWSKYYDTVSDSLTPLAQNLLGTYADSKDTMALKDTAEYKQVMGIKNIINSVSDRFKNIASTGFGSIKLDDLSSTKDKSTPSPIDYEDLSKEFIKAFNYQVEIDKIQAKSLEKQIKIAEKAKDYNKIIELQNQLLTNQNKTVDDLLLANQNISKEAQNVRDANPQYNTESWFDINGEASIEYKNALNAYAGATDDASKEVHQHIQDTFTSLYNLKTAWRDNTEEIEVMGNAIDNSNQNISDTLNEYYDKLISVEKKKQQLELDEMERRVKAQVEIHKQNIENYQDEIDALEEKAELEDQIAERQQRQLELSELQLELQNVLDNRDVQILKKQEDGTWNYAYIADPDKIEDLNDEIKSKQEDFTKWESENIRNAEKKQLQALIDGENDKIDVLENSLEDQKEAFNTGFDALESSSIENLDSLNLTLGSKWDIILQTIKEKVAAALAEQAKFNNITPNSNNNSNTYYNGTDTSSLNESDYSDYVDSVFEEAGLAEGGEVSSTGLRKLHGTPEMPERVLSPTQTAGFNKLIDNIPNLLNGIDITKNLISRINLPNLSGISNNNSISTSNTYHFDKLVLPGVTDSTQIEKAFKNLSGFALQVART